MYDETIWAKRLRVLAWIICAGGVIGGIRIAWTSAKAINTWGGQSSFAFGTFMVILIITLVGTFLLMAVIMVFLDIATDIAITKETNFEILKTLQQNTDGTKHIKCNSCNQIYDTSFNSCPHCGYRPSGDKPSLSSIAGKIPSAAANTWVCPQCSEKTPLSLRVCKGCGKHKT
jgi:hypothetical protein